MSVFNGERFLADAIESIRRQTVEELEFIIVDDGSTDNSPAIAQDHARRDSRLRVLRKPHAGLADALNCGCQAARAEFIARMDADDIAFADRLERQIAILEGGHVSAVGGAAVVIDVLGAPQYLLRYPQSHDEIGAALIRWNCIAHPTVALRRSALETVGGYRRAFLHAEDYDLWLRLSERFKLQNLADPVLYLRRHAGQVSGRFIEQQIISELAARGAAVARRNSAKDPIGHDDTVTLRDLRTLGLPDRLVRRSILSGYAARAADHMLLGDRASAKGLIEEAYTRSWSRGSRRQAYAELQLALARGHLRLGRAGGAVLAMLRASALAPNRVLGVSFLAALRAVRGVGGSCRGSAKIRGRPGAGT